MKKLISIMLILAVALVCFGGCIGAPIETIIPTPEATPTLDVPDTTPEPLKILEFSAFMGNYKEDYRYGKSAEFLLEEWGLKCTRMVKMMTDMGGLDNNYLRLFAGNDFPDVIFNYSFNPLTGEQTQKEIGESGKIIDFMPYIEKGALDNYMNYIWGDAPEKWEYALALIKTHSTDELNILPARNYETAYYSWLYNSNYYGTRYNTDVPPSDLDTIVRIMKNFVSENPGCSAMLYNWGPSNNGTWGQWGYYEREPIFNACGVLHSNEWRIQGGAVSYSLMQDEYLDAIRIYKSLMDEGVLFAQDSTNVRNGKGIYSSMEDAVKNNGALFAWNNVNSLVDYNKWAKEANENYEWAVLPEDPALNGKTPISYNNPPVTFRGSVITQNASLELRDRLVAYFDWCATPEGEMLCKFGIEGLSYELVDGKVKFIKYYSDEITPDIRKSTNEKNNAEYYMVGVDFKVNSDHMSKYSIYETGYDKYKVIYDKKINAMIENGQYNCVGAWGDESVAAQAVGKTVEEIKTIENNVMKICGNWRNAYYNGEATDADFTKMKADAIAAGYEAVLAYRKALYEDAMN